MNCVTNFVLDYMHLVCLGVMRRMINYWKSESSSISRARLSPAMIRSISSRLVQLNGKFPSIFARQPRSLSESDRWKATEFRQFLLYSGMVVLQNVLSTSHYQHYLLLAVAMSILLDDDTTFRASHTDYAEELLKSFVKYSSQVFGPCFRSYNVHSLVHIADHCRTHGCSLNDISAFPFESALKQLKRVVRNSNNPIVSIARTITDVPDLLTRDVNSTSRQKFTSNARNSAVLLKDYKLGLITQVSSDFYLMKVLPSEVLSDLFEIPCKSSLLSIYKVSSHIISSVPEVRISKSNVLRQCIYIPYTNDCSTMVFLPLRHS
jgi:hypothetical protein